MTRRWCDIIKRGDRFEHPHSLDTTAGGPLAVQVTSVRGETVYYRAVNRQTGEMEGTSWYVGAPKVHTWKRIT